MSKTFPNLDTILDRYDSSPEVRESFDWQIDILKRIQGGLAVARRHRFSFDPVVEYWYRPERRALVALFASRWHERYAPVEALRSLALNTFGHFEREDREQAIRAPQSVEYAAVGGWRALAEELIAHAERLPPQDDYPALRRIWTGKTQPVGLSMREHLRDFFESTARAEESWPTKHEPSFARRLPWFPYLNATDAEDLRTRQRFFYAYANLLMSTNSYRYAASMSFASVIQNTPVERVLDQINSWTEGERPDQAGFMTLGADDTTERDRSNWSTVVELYGFVVLDRAPFINNISLAAYQRRFGTEAAGGQTDNPYELVSRAAAITNRWLKERPQAAARLRAILEERAARPTEPINLRMEGVYSSRALSRAGQEPDAGVDGDLLSGVNDAANDWVSGLDEQRAAACALHSLLDAHIYRQTALPPAVSSAAPVEPASDRVVATARARSAGELTLPDTLRPIGERALAYLGARMHVLFAGAPGTGKTVLSQFVADAWNRGADELADRISFADLPLTTVANSAWSPFHTIGGIRQNRDGRFVSHKGIFIDPSGSGGDWQLLPNCIVLDEMNRADLDRCIGELYPLLSGSVASVRPAGIPSVDFVRSHPRFRIIATINDATLDDIVFPISDGLARRFQRIELVGASYEDVCDFLAQEGAHEGRLAAGHAEVRALFSSQSNDRLPFGAGYFRLLQRWCSGELTLDGTALRAQAHSLVGASLASLPRATRAEVMAGFDEQTDDG